MKKIISYTTQPLALILALIFGNLHIAILVACAYALVSLSPPDKERINNLKPWEWRNIASLTGLVVSVVLSALHHTLEVPLRVSYSIAITLGLVMLVNTLITDFKDYFVAKELSIRAYYIALAAPLVHIFTETNVDESIWQNALATFPPIFVALLLPAFMLFQRGIGIGDIRLFLLFAVATSWWGYGLVGYFGYALLLSAVLGLITALFAKLLNKGRWKEFPKTDIRSTLKKKKGVKVETVKKRVIPYGQNISIAFTATAITSLFVANLF